MAKENVPESTLRLNPMGGESCHLPEVLEIENRTFARPWSKEDFCLCMEQRNCIATVAELNNRVVGYTVCKILPDHLQILTMAVNPDFRRRGIATQMLKHLLSKLTSARRSSVYLRIDERNLPAQMFAKSCGFVVETTDHHFFSEPVADAYQMCLRQKSPEKQALDIIDKLESITGVQWELAKKLAPGEYARCEIEHSMRVDLDWWCDHGQICETPARHARPSTKFGGTCPT